MTESSVPRPRKKVVQPPSLSDLAEGINTEHRQVERAARYGLAHGIRAGQLLLEAKELAGHGNFVRWVKGNCDFSMRTAQEYMQVATFPCVANTRQSALLTIRAALREVKGKARIPPALYEDGSVERNELDAIADAIGRSAQELTSIAARMSQARPPSLRQFPRFISTLELTIEAMVNWERYCQENDQEPRKYEGFTFPGSSNHQTVLPLKDSLLVIEIAEVDRFILSRIDDAFTDHPRLALSSGVADIKEVERQLASAGTPRHTHWFSLVRNERPLSAMGAEELERRLQKYARESTKLSPRPPLFSAYALRLQRAFNADQE